MLVYLNSIVDCCHVVNKIHSFNVVGEYILVSY